MQLEYTSCLICGSDKTIFLGRRISPDRDTRLETDIVRCSSCGLVYPNPMPCFKNEDIQNNFNDPVDYFEKDAEMRLEIFENPLREIERELPQKGAILDVGCGRGELLYAAGKRGWQATGTDISESFVDYARKKFNANALAGDLKDIKLPQGAYDAATLVSVIQYLQDPMGTLKKIQQLLKKDGILYIEATNEDALVFIAGDILKSIREGRKVTTHLSPLFPSYQLYGFNKSSLSAALESAGFTILYIKTGGMFGGGRVGGGGLGNSILNLIRKLIIFIGGITGRGHLIFCIAKKREAE